MDKLKSKRFLSALVIFAAVTLLSACVTQNFENDDSPIINNEATNYDIAMTRISLGLGYLKMGNMPQAKLNLEKAKKFAPNLVQVHTAFAHYYEVVGEHTLTIKAYETALSIKPNDADTLNNYGVYLCRQNQVEAAEKQFIKAIAVPAYLLVSQSYENLAQCQLRVDNFVKAERYLNKAISHNSGSASTLAQMIRLQYAMGKYTQARFFVQRFEKVTRRFTADSLALAYKVYFKLGNHKIAKNYGTMLVKMYPQSWEAKQYLLNDLAVIEADNLAKRYRLVKDNPEKSGVKVSKKRIVILSPNKHSVTSIKAKTPLVEKIAKPLPKTVKSIKNVKNTASKVDTNVKPEVVSTLKHKVANNEIIEKKEQAIHIVQKGDTLYGISMKYNIKMFSLRKWNGLKKNERLYIGNVLLLIDPKTMQKH